jgi:hypothetical protein
MQRRAPLTLISLLIVIAIVATIMVARTYRTVSFRLDRDSIKPGESFQLVATFINTWPSEVNGAGLSVVDSEGVNRLVTSTQVERIAGINDTVFWAGPSYSASAASDAFAKLKSSLPRSGFMAKGEWDVLNGQLPMSGIASGECWAGGAATDRAPLRSVKRETWTVLPETSPGTYTITVHAGRYCAPESANPAARLRLVITK